MTEILKTILTNLWYIMLILGVFYIIYSIICIEIERKNRKKQEAILDKEIKDFSDKMTDMLLKSLHEKDCNKEKECNCEKKTKKNK